MRFAAASKQGSGNWIAAGKTGATNAANLFNANVAYSPDYGGIASEWQKAESSKEVTATKAQAAVVEKGINTTSQLKQAEHKRDADKFVGDLERKTKFAGKLAAIGGMVAEGLRKDDSDRPLPPVTVDTDALREARERANVQNGLNPDGSRITTDTPETPTQPATAPEPQPAANTDNDGGGGNGSDGDGGGTSTELSLDSDGSVTFQKVYDWAAQKGAKFPGLVASQWALESGNGESTLATTHNNLFGQKGQGVNMPTQEQGSNGMVSTNADFMTFETPQDSVGYLVDRWYKDFKNFKGVNNANTFTEAAQMLKSEGYATDSAYVDKLIRIARENGINV